MHHIFKVTNRVVRVTEPTKAGTVFEAHAYSVGVRWDHGEVSTFFTFPEEAIYLENSLVHVSLVEELANVHRK